METTQCILYTLYGLFSDSVRVGNVTEFQESTETLHYFTGNMALNSWQINLHRRYELVCERQGQMADLHQGFRVVSHPLFEALTLRKTVKMIYRLSMSSMIPVLALAHAPSQDTVQPIEQSGP